MDFRVAALLAGVALLLVVRLIVGDNPWEGGIAERLGEGKHLRPVDFARTYGWWSAALNLPLCLGLLATRRHWFTRSEPRESISLRPPDAMPRRLVVATLAAVVVLALLGLPRLGHSFWDDEEYSVRVAIDGAYFQGLDDQLDFDDVRWRDTLWHYHKPSNHVPQSILSRLALGVWRSAARP